MVEVLRKKPPFIIFMMYLAVAIIGVSSFSVTGTLLLFQDNERLVNSKDLLHTIKHNIDFLAESTATVNRSCRSLSISLRSWWLRMFTPFNMQNTETYFTAMLLQTVNECYISIPKNTMLINLRI